MSFNRSNPDDLLKLKDEVSNDPAVMGYASAGNTDDLLNLFNLPENNALPENGNAPMSAKDLLDIIFVENISAGDQFRIQALFESTQGLFDDLSPFKVAVSALDTGLDTKISGLVRPLSRVEVLFAVDDVNGVREFVTISKTDWFAARDAI